MGHLDRGNIQRRGEGSGCLNQKIRPCVEDFFLAYLLAFRLDRTKVPDQITRGRCPLSNSCNASGEDGDEDCSEK